MRRRRPASTEEHRYTITDRGTATLKGALDEDVTFSFTAIPDRAPTIALTKDPEPQLRGALQLSLTRSRTTTASSARRPSSR